MTSQESSLWTRRVQITISPAEGNQQAGSIVHLIIISHLAFNLIKSCHSPLIPLSPSAESMYQCVAGSIQLPEIEINTLSSSLLTSLPPEDVTLEGFARQLYDKMLVQRLAESSLSVLSSLRLAVSVWSWDWALNCLSQTGVIQQDRTLPPLSSLLPL